ncbi:unnamed protein product [Didymodactylos carnosus]|uniref:Uncharacterized protein n=1 Tax=Didymodactylos carnosus TaxID=1234261 RepID=A0A815Z795_9BILA|nr:unnamed protein product [Didymodactylos carnosus]CAF1581127.1 unnamed protein product [Didymodactylos carnosus]CAF4057919.1 unnamed protein product [Didymodactylos carnosus]CAF4448704.1 unnamed protein product [Didymodactylos carnosus]
MPPKEARGDGGYRGRGARVSDIQANRSDTFTLQASDVKSFNRLLNDLSTYLNGNGQQQTVVYIPRSIQRILEAGKTKN